MIIPDGSRLKIYPVRCIVRLWDVDQGPYLSHNDHHWAVGIDGPEAIHRSERIAHVEFARGPDRKHKAILSGWVSPNAWMARAGIHAGFSGGVSRANIHLGIGGEFVDIHDPRLYGQGHNLWCGWDTVVVDDPEHPQMEPLLWGQVSDPLTLDDPAAGLDVGRLALGPDSRAYLTTGDAQ